MINLSEDKDSQFILSTVPIALSTPGAFPPETIAYSTFNQSSSHSCDGVKRSLSLANYQKDSLPQSVGPNSLDSIGPKSSKYIQRNSKIQKTPTIYSAFPIEHSHSEIGCNPGTKESKSQEYHQNKLINFRLPLADHTSQVNDQVVKLMGVFINQKKLSSQHKHVDINGLDSLEMFSLQERGSNAALKTVSTCTKDSTLKSQLHTRKLIFQNKKKPTLIPVFSLVKDRSLQGNKKLDNTSKCQNYDYTCDSKLAKKLGKSFSKRSNVYYNLRFRYTKSSNSYLKNKKAAPNDDGYIKSINKVDFPSSFSTKISGFHEGYSIKNTSKSELLRQSDSISSILYTSCGSIDSETSEVRNQNNSHKRITPEHKSNGSHSSYRTNNRNVSSRIHHVLDPILSTRPIYQSQIPKSRHTDGKQSYFSISHTNLLSSNFINSQSVETESSSHRWVEGNNRQIHTKQPNSFWCGRFTALHDRFHNDMLEELVIDRKTFSRFQDGSRPSESTRSNVGLNDYIETTTGLQYLNEEETRRCKKSFIHLGALCVTDEAKKSLWNFQLAYARFHGIRQLLPSGGEM